MDIFAYFVSSLPAVNLSFLSTTPKCPRESYTHWPVLVFSSKLPWLRRSTHKKVLCCSEHVHAHQGSRWIRIIFFGWFLWIVQFLELCRPFCSTFVENSSSVPDCASFEKKSKLASMTVLISTLVSDWHWVQNQSKSPSHSCVFFSPPGMSAQSSRKPLFSSLLSQSKNEFFHSSTSDSSQYHLVFAFDDSNVMFPEVFSLGREFPLPLAGHLFRPHIFGVNSWGNQLWFSRSVDFSHLRKFFLGCRFSIV